MLTTIADRAVDPSHCNSACSKYALEPSQMFPGATPGNILLPAQRQRPSRGNPIRCPERIACSAPTPSSDRAEVLTYLWH